MSKSIILFAINHTSYNSWARSSNHHQAISLERTQHIVWSLHHVTCDLNGLQQCLSHCLQRHPFFFFFPPFFLFVNKTLCGFAQLTPYNQAPDLQLTTHAKSRMQIIVWISASCATTYGIISTAECSILCGFVITCNEGATTGFVML